MSSPISPTPRNQVFISYSHKDREWLNKLQTFLKPMIRNQELTVWDDTQIVAGADWRQEIEGALTLAKVAVLLVSQDFLASDFVHNDELPHLLDAAKNEGLTIIWVPIRYSTYKNSEIAKYQAAHPPNQPLSSLGYAEQEEALVNICESIKKAARANSSLTHISPPQTPITTTNTPSIRASPTPSNPRFQKLENYLKNRQWEKADDETYRLMITTVGKKEGDWFTPQELLNFPCKELLAIDGLWVKYSNGQFGFSVQKEIYLECGGIPDGTYHKEVIEKFGDRVRWRENGRLWKRLRENGRSWKLFRAITSAPKGHLPYGLEGWGGNVWGFFVCSLLSHPDL